MTLAKLAELTKTSVGTVSKAFSGSKEISDKTRQYIFKIAKKNGCFDKYYKGVRKRPLIALMIPEPESEAYGNNIGIFERTIYAKGADVIVAYTRFDKEQEARIFHELAYTLKVDGIILSGSGAMIKNPDEIPLVVFSSHKVPNADMIQSDVDSAMITVMQTLKEYGHTEVGFIGEALTSSREQSYKKALRCTGIAVNNAYIANSNKRFAEAGEDCMRQLIKRGKLPTVIVAAYDQIAYGAMRYAREAGYKIPDDISFIGIDDITPDSYFDIPLCSLHIDLESECERITDLIFKRIENKHYREPSTITIPVKFNVRESLKRLK